MPRDCLAETARATEIKPDLTREARILLRAAELVERGHCKYRLWDDSRPDHCTRVCLQGGVIMAIAEECGSRDAWNVGDKDPEIPIFGGMEKLEALVAFNNAPATTPAMVAAKLRELAAERS